MLRIHHDASNCCAGWGRISKWVPSNACEVYSEALTALEIAQLNAWRKARAVAQSFPDALVLGSDTLVYLDTTLFGKPTDLADAFRMLSQLQGRTHRHCYRGLPN